MPRFQLYIYPDVLLIQGEPAFQAQRTDVVLNPCLVIEVLSKSTRAYDRAEKFRAYRSIPEFREYLLIDQDQFAVEQYTRIAEAAWIFKTYESATDRVALGSVSLELALSDIYEKVDFQLSDSESPVSAALNSASPEPSGLPPALPAD